MEEYESSDSNDEEETPYEMTAPRGPPDKLLFGMQGELLQEPEVQGARAAGGPEQGTWTAEVATDLSSRSCGAHHANDPAAGSAPAGRARGNTPTLSTPRQALRQHVGRGDASPRGITMPLPEA